MIKALSLTWSAVKQMAFQGVRESPDFTDWFGTTTVWHEIFAGSNFCDFWGFSSNRQNKFPQIK